MIGLVHTVFVFAFAITEEVNESPDDQSNESKETAAIIIAIILQLIFIGLESFCFFLVYRKSNQTLEIMLKFHDYLI